MTDATCEMDAACFERNDLCNGAGNAQSKASRHEQHHRTAGRPDGIPSHTEKISINEAAPPFLPYGRGVQHGVRPKHPHTCLRVHRRKGPYATGHSPPDRPVSLPNRQRIHGAWYVGLINWAGESHGTDDLHAAVTTAAHNEETGGMGGSASQGVPTAPAQGCGTAAYRIFDPGITIA